MIPSVPARICYSYFKLAGSFKDHQPDFFTQNITKKVHHDLRSVVRSLVNFVTNNLLIFILTLTWLLLELLYSSIIIFHWFWVNLWFTKTPTCCSLDEQSLTEVSKFNCWLISDFLKLSAHYSLPSIRSRDTKADRTFYFLFIQANRAGKTSFLYTENYWLVFID